MPRKVEFRVEDIGESRPDDPKGRGVGRELTTTAGYPNIDMEKLPSRTAAGAAILRIGGLADARRR